MHLAEGLPPGAPRIRVRPRYADGRPKPGWQAGLIHRSSELLILCGPLQREADLGYVTFALGDTLLERYWFHRWYNVFTLYEPHGQLKGWYANICTPISFDGQSIRYTDLDLDLWVWPDRRHLVLDEEEFAARVEPAFPAVVIQRACAALASLLDDLRGHGPLFQDPLPLS